ncbi:MAG: glycosyltransferase family 2 protein [Anaerolineae bacterium]|nr:glycosyltransferase family 2 protein [Anaerolineae bacterium]
MIDLAIVIVNWNVRDLLAACLRSVEKDLAAGKLSGEVWVVDNASEDGSVTMLRRDFPWVRLIDSDKNLGFAGGNNAALRAMGFDADHALETNKPEAVLLLNPDTLVHPGALEALVTFLRQTPKAGIAGARLVYGDGTFQHGAFAFPGLWQLAIELLPLPARLVDSRLNGRYSRALYEGGEPFLIGHPLGAALCVKAAAIEQAGLLDEAYHMYVEEVDWSKRIVEVGWQAYCVPEAMITHLGGQSTGQIKMSSFLNLWRSRYRFYCKYYGSMQVQLARHIVHIGMQRLAAADRQAVVQGHLTHAEQKERQACYTQIINLWQERDLCQKSSQLS